MEMRIAEEDWKAIRQHLDAAAPREEGGFVVVSRSTNSVGNVLLAKEVILPEPGDWQHQGNHFLTPTTAFINRAVTRADAAGAGLLVFHSHPDPHHPARLSHVDITSTELLFQNLASLLPGQPLASIVLTPFSVAGTTRVDGQDRDLEEVIVLGGRIDRFPVAGRAASRLARADVASDRQVRVFGAQAQARLAALKVAVVGAGGTGSAVLEQLARLGVDDVLIIDDDELDASNITRVYGSKATDIPKHPKKVDLAARNYMAIRPKAKVTTTPRSLIDPGVAASLLHADVVFGCTDTDSSRAVLNDLAQGCFIPVIDTGCKVDVREGAVHGVFGRVRVLLPGLPCLWCTGTIDGRRVLMESMTPEERAKLRESGYGFNEGPQPMVIQLTTAVASLAVNEFLRLFANLGPPHDGSYTLLDMAESSLTRVSAKIQPTCRCLKMRARGPVVLP